MAQANVGQLSGGGSLVGSRLIPSVKPAVLPNFARYVDNDCVGVKDKYFGQFFTDSEHLCAVACKTSAEVFESYTYLKTPWYYGVFFSCYCKIRDPGVSLKPSKGRICTLTGTCADYSWRKGFGSAACQTVNFSGAASTCAVVNSHLSNEICNTISCPAGQTSISGTCQKCSLGTTSLGGHHSICDIVTVSCKPGQTLSGSTCNNCNAGTSSPGGSVTTCAITCSAGQYSKSGGICQTCDPNFTSTAGAGSCTLNCAAGQHASMDGKSCVNCDAGDSSPGGSVATCDITCSAGTYSTEGTACKNCSPGFFSSDKAFACASAEMLIRVNAVDGNLLVGYIGIPNGAVENDNSDVVPTAILGLGYNGLKFSRLTSSSTTAILSTANSFLGCSPSPIGTFNYPNNFVSNCALGIQNSKHKSDLLNYISWTIQDSTVYNEYRIIPTTRNGTSDQSINPTIFTYVSTGAGSYLFLAMKPDFQNYVDNYTARTKATDTKYFYTTKHFIEITFTLVSSPASFAKGFLRGSIDNY